MSDNLENKAARGSISQIILKALSTGDKYGYEIIKDIELLTDGKLILKQPSLYSSLRRMEEQDLISSYWKDSDIGGKRHYYSITAKGKDLFEENKKNWTSDDELINSLPAKEDDYESYEESDFVPKSNDENVTVNSTLVLNQENLFNLQRHDKDIKKIDADKEAEQNEDNKSFFQFDFFEQNIKFVKENSKEKQEITAFSNKYSNLDNKGSEIEPEKKTQISAYINNNQKEKVDDLSLFNDNTETENSSSLEKKEKLETFKTPTPILKSNRKISRDEVWSNNLDEAKYILSDYLENNDDLINANLDIEKQDNNNLYENTYNQSSDAFENSNNTISPYILSDADDIQTNNYEETSFNKNILNNYDSELESSTPQKDNKITWDFETEYSDENALFSDSDYKAVIGQLYNNSRLDDPYEKNKFQTFKEIFPHSQVKNEEEIEQQKLEQEEKQKEKLNQILKSSEESNIDCEDIKKLNSLYNLQGIQIKVHSNQHNKMQTKKYTDKNKINMVCSWIVSAIMILELLLSFYVLKTNNIYVKNTSLVYFLGTAITLSYCLISTFENLFDRFRLVIITKSFKKSFLQRIFIFILLIVAIFALNLAFGMTSLLETNYISFWLIPTLLASNLPISSIVYYLLLKSKAYNS